MQIRRIATLTVLVVVAVSILLLATLPALTQTTGWQGQTQRQGQGQRQGGADRLFDMLAQGGDTLAITSAGQLQAQLEEFAKEQGITSGTVTREQFAQFSQQLTQNALAGKGVDLKSAFGDLRQKLGDWSSRNKDAGGGSAQSWADMQGAWRDKINQRLSDNAGQSAGAPAGDATANLDDLDKRPIVFRAGKLPKGLPAWFAQLDTDLDGQVGLYEWRHGDKTIAEFQAMDRNGDGLLTPEEVLYFIAKQTGDAAKLSVAKTGDGFGGLALQVEPTLPVPAPAAPGWNAGGNPRAWPRAGTQPRQ